MPLGNCFTKSWYAFLILGGCFLFSLSSCTKTETITVPTEPLVSGTQTFNGDTTFVEAQNIKIRYHRSSPCFPSNEVFYFKVMSANYPNNVEYNWEFGDGNSAKGVFVQNIYQWAGVYTLILNINVDGKTVQRLTTSIKPWGQRVTPIASFYTQLNNPNDPNYVAFNAQASLASGSIINYFWDWNDGKTNNVNTSYTEHRFPEIPSDKNYLVKLTVSSNAGCATTFSDTVKIPAKYNLSGNFSFVKSPACKPDSEVITFTADTTGVPKNAIYEWDFGDGISGQTGNPIKKDYTYTKTYPVILRIKLNGRVIAIGNRSVYALGKDINPIAYINSSYAKNPPSNTIWEFSGWARVGDGHFPQFLVWDFGDGTKDTRNASVTTHTFIPTSTPRTYNVKLIVTATSGCKDSVTRVITIP